MSFSDLAKQFALKKLPDSEVELVGEIPADLLVPYEAPALKHLSEHVELPGFRKGHVPQDMVRKKLGDIAILEEAVELLLQDLYPELIAAHKLDIVGRPAVNITKLAVGNPAGITVRAAVYPEITLPKDWKTLNEKTPLEPYMGELPKMEVAPSPEEEAKARDYIAKDKRRGALIDALLAGTTVEIPKIFVESELEKIMGQLREDITRFGLKFEDYLKQVQKDEDAVRQDFREQAKKRAKLQLTLNKIAEVEKVEADKEAVEKEVKHALEHFPKARPDLVRVHVDSVLRNEKVLKLLEGEEKKA